MQQQQQKWEEHYYTHIWSSILLVAQLSPLIPLYVCICVFVVSLKLKLISESLSIAMN